MKSLRFITLIVFMGVALMTGCSDDQGPDIISPGGSPPRDISGYACVDCHLDPDMPSINPLLIAANGADGKHQDHYDDIKIECERCHFNYASSPTHFDVVSDADDPAVSLVAFDTFNPDGAWVNDTGAGEGQCSTTDCHGADVPYWYGVQAAKPDCVGCHILPEAGAINPLLTAGSGTAGKHDMHVTTRQLDCEKCHDGYFPDPAHRNGVFNSGAIANNIVAFDATNPSGIWNADNNGAGEGRCATTDCHNPDTLNWYDATVWVAPTCDSCHDAAIGTRKPVMGALGNFAENAAMVTFHVVNTVDPADAQCVVCHDQSNHMSGTIRLSNADTSAITVLDESDLSTAESFCLSCHDLDGANGNNEPFGDGITLGEGLYQMSAEIESRWNRANGHRREGLTCLGTGEPNTGCHEGGHGSEFAGLLTKNLLLPPNRGAFTTDQEPDFALCFECHDSYPAVTKEVVLGVKEFGVYDNTTYWGVAPPYKLTTSTQTKFLDRNNQYTGDLYDGVYMRYDNPTLFGDRYFNLHFVHIGDWWSRWKYRGSIDGSGAPGCITCHDMHGTDSQVGFLYDELQYAHYNGVGSDKYGQMGIPAAELQNFPINCAGGMCHQVMEDMWGNSHAWFGPAID